MNARTDSAVLQSAEHHLSNAHLDALEEETIFILREVAAAFERPALLFSGGKDSLVMLKCAEKAFGIGRNLTIQVLEFLDRCGATRFARERRWMREAAPGLPGAAGDVSTAPATSSRRPPCGSRRCSRR